MVMHFDSRALAIAHLIANGWSEIKNGNWVSSDKSCKATIMKAGGEVVAVYVSQIHRTRAA